ncbi:MAG: 30S ribosomal protein S18 [Candidatus Bostrichicola ureolyticus]|nr:MAG: 30S ribosomal protein S18 [Candidatus Bostrichicola ureolyticus]
MNNNNNQEQEFKYLSQVKIDTPPKSKYCFFKKNNIKYIDYKSYDFLIKFINPQGKILPRSLTGTSKKFQKKLSIAIKRARHIAILPFISDELK